MTTKKGKGGARGPIQERKTEFTWRDEDRLCDWLLRKKSINYVKACDTLGFDYEAIEARIQERGRLYTKLNSALKKLKAIMLSDIFDACVKGDVRGMPSTAQLKFIISLIDSGALLGGGAGNIIPEGSLPDEEDDPLKI